MKTILVVDDESDVANVVMATLQDEGYRVVVASNGEQGMERLRECNPDLLVCDVMMPFMDGATMLQRIRNDPAYQDLPIIIASVMNEATRLPGHDGFLHKPFRLAVLLDMVGALLQQRAAERRYDNGRLS